jgi:hypothetical protein
VLDHLHALVYIISQYELNWSLHFAIVLTAIGELGLWTP